jgi:hypothetical protein
MDEWQVRLSQIALEVGARFLYAHDFGDNWEHALVIEQIFPPDPGVSYPHSLDGKRACPPEDVGGASLLAKLLALVFLIQTKLLDKQFF